MKNMTYYEKGSLTISSIVLILALGGFCITINKCNEAEILNKRQTAINEIYKLKNKDYLNTLARLHIVAGTTSSSETSFNCEIILQLYETKNCLKANDLLLGDISYMFNTFENISAFYSNDLVDKELMRKLTCEETREFGFILSRIAYTLHQDAGEYFERLPWKDFNNLMNVCGGDTTILKL
jgi:hypothetical protein